MSSTTRSSDALFAQATKHLPGGNSRTTLFVEPHPPYAVRGEGHRVVDADGHWVIDLQNNYTTLIHGHAHPQVVAAAGDALRDGTCVGLPSRHEIALAEHLSGRVAAGERWRFTNSGTEAVMFAIRLARAATGRQAIVRFRGAYHGSYDAVVAASSPGIHDAMARESVVVEFGDVPGLREAMSTHGPRVAAVLFDAMPNRAGLCPASAAFATAVEAEARRHGALLIQDEVLTFRTDVGGLHTRYGLRPDIVTLGKVIGGGFAVGAVGGRADLMACFDPRRRDRVDHPGTFSANPITMRAGLATLRLFGGEEIDRLEALGDRLRAELSAQGWRVTGLGSLLRVHVQDPQRLWWVLYRHGVLLANNGLACLSTPMTDAVVDTVIDAFADVAASRMFEAV